MKKALLFALIGSALSLALSLALAHPDAARPGGVAADAWIPVSPDAGFVVTGGAARVSPVPRSMPTTRGFGPIETLHATRRRYFAPA